MRPHRRPAATTLAAVGTMLALGAGFTAYAVRTVAAIEPGRNALRREELLLGLNPHQANNVTALTAGLIGVMCAITVVLAVGVLRRRAGARYGAIGLFGFLAVVVLAAALPGVLATPPTPNAAYGVLCGVANAAIVGLLLTPATADDFDEVEHRRQWLRVRGEPLVPDRRSRGGGSWQ